MIKTNQFKSLRLANDAPMISAFVRFNGFARNELPERLLDDLWSHDIFNERDMHSSAYHYIREFFRSKKRHSIYVRCEPQLAGMRPDIVIYLNGEPIYVLEFKFFSKCDHISNEKILDDIKKLDECVRAFPTVRWGFFHMMYDAEELLCISDYRLRSRGLSKVSAITINARRNYSGRQRHGYRDWRSEFDRLHERQREYS